MERTTKSLLHSNRSSQHGQSAVEIAVMLPALFIILFGIIMLGFMLTAFVQVSNAAREGARAGSVFRLTRIDQKYTSIDQAVQQAIYNPVTGISALGYLPTTAPSFNVAADVQTILVSASDGTKTDPQPGDQLTVNITYRYTLPIVSALLPMIPQPVIIQRSVVMEIQ